MINTIELYNLIKMKLLTHNLLICNRKACSGAGIKNFPLRLKVSEWSDYDEDTAIACTTPLVKRLAEKLEWGALRETVASVSKVRMLE